jgi:hypothetical protein
MKDTELDPVVAPAAITIEAGEGWKFVTLASPESRLSAPKILSTLSAVFYYPKSEEYSRWSFLPTPPRTIMLLGCKRCSRPVPPQQSRAFVMALHLVRKTEVSSQMERYAPSVRLVTGRQLQVSTDAQFRPPLCYLVPDAPVS